MSDEPLEKSAPPDIPTVQFELKQADASVATDADRAAYRNSDPKGAALEVAVQGYATHATFYRSDEDIPFAASEPAEVSAGDQVKTTFRLSKSELEPAANDFSIRVEIFVLEDKDVEMAAWRMPTVEPDCTLESYRRESGLPDDE